MRHFIVALFFTCVVFKSEAQDKLYYKANTITMYAECGSKKQGEKIIGKDVRITVDTLFNKYIINFRDEDEQRTEWVLKFVEATDVNIKLYKVISGDKTYYSLLDAMHSNVVRMLIITGEKKLENGCLGVFLVKEVEEIR